MRGIKAGHLFRILVVMAIPAAGCNDGLVRVTPVVGGVTIVSPPASIEVGESAHLSATVSTSSGQAITGARVYWGAEDTTILQVDSLTGVAHARAPGTTRVAASSEDMHAAVSITVPQGRLIALDSIVDDELSVADDADEFTFRVTAPQEVNVLLRGRSGVAAQRFRLRLMGSGGELIDTVSSGGADSVLARQAIRWAKLTQAGTYRLRVEGSLAGDRGAYQLRVQKIDTRPESIPDTTIRNNTRVKGEALAPGDVDVFTFLSTIPNQDVSVLFRALSKSPADALRVYLLTPTGNELVFVQSNGNDPFDQGSGHQLLTVPGRYSLRVQGMDAEDNGPYELEFLAIRRTPEKVDSVIIANLTTALEDISPQGDIDEFTYRAATSKEVNIYFRGNDSSADTLWLRLLDSRNNTVDSVRVLGSDTSLLAHAT